GAAAAPVAQAGAHAAEPPRRRAGHPSRIAAAVRDAASRQPPAGGAGGRAGRRRRRGRLGGSSLTTFHLLPMTARFESKILDPDTLRQALQDGRLARPLVFTNGVFDILHRGHATYLDAAAQLGATLVVALNTD